MHMIDVMKKLAELDSATPPKAQTQLTNDPTIAIVTESAMGECGPMGMSMTPGMMPGASTTPATFSINASAANGGEVSTMLRDILNLAGMKEVGAGDINPKDAGGPLTGEPPQGGDEIKQALSAIDGIEDEEMQMGGEVPALPMDMGDAGAEMGTAGPAGGDVGAMADQVSDMADQLANTSKDELGLESLRQFDNSPQEHTREYNPNEFANMLNKVRGFDTVPARGGDNPLKQESVEQADAPVKEEGIASLTTKLYQEYQGFIKNI